MKNPQPFSTWSNAPEHPHVHLNSLCGSVWRVPPGRLRIVRFFLALVLACLATTPVCKAALSLQTIYEFKSSPPRFPQAGLVQADDGNFYGTTVGDGMNGDFGTVYRITPGGVLTVLHSFRSSDGELPVAGLVQGKDGQLYGTAQGGGAHGDFGTIFRISTNGEFAVLLSFSGPDGRYPQAALSLGTNGDFYGTTAFGGTNADNGTVFKITPSGELTSLYSFGGIDGSRPISSTLPASDGTIYGATLEGGRDWDGVDLFGDGTLFQITPDGTLTTLVSFEDCNGSFPAAGLVLGNDGNFYGTTQFGGTNDNGYGTVYQLAPDGTLTSLYSFTGLDSKYPQAPLVQARDGSFFGTAAQGLTTKGTVFQVTTNGEFTTIFSFNGTNGALPLAGLVQGNDGGFYGTTYEGGAANAGTVFRLIELSDAPSITGVTAINGIVTLSWTSVAERIYRVEHAANLAAPNWIALVPDVIATGNTSTVTNNVEGETQRYYRIRVLP